MTRNSEVMQPFTSFGSAIFQTEEQKDVSPIMTEFEDNKSGMISITESVEGMYPLSLL